MLTALALGVLAGPLDPLLALKGNWTGTSEGQSGKAAVTRSYEPVYEGRYLKVETTARFPAKNGKPGEVHRDTGFFSFDRTAKTLALREFHVEGFVNTYRQQPASANQFRFETRDIENLGEGWRARVVLTIASSKELREEFAIAEPGKEFEVYSTSKLVRAGRR